MNLPSSSPSEGWILLDAIMEALLDASRASWTSLSSALASSDFAADDFADDDELELLATEEAKNCFINHEKRKTSYRKRYPMTSLTMMMISVILLRLLLLFSS